MAITINQLLSKLESNIIKPIYHLNNMNLVDKNNKIRYAFTNNVMCSDLLCKLIELERAYQNETRHLPESWFKFDNAYFKNDFWIDIYCRKTNPSDIELQVKIEKLKKVLGINNNNFKLLNYEQY